MSEPIHDTAYWRRRLESAKHGELHHAIFKTSLPNWKAIEEKHRAILAKHIFVADSVLDCGCGWGRLLTLMPKLWGGFYFGLDISPDFITMATETWPFRHFETWDMLKPLKVGGIVYDWAMLISIRPMVKRNMGDEAWATMEANIRKCAKRLLFLEYDPLDEGSVE